MKKYLNNKERERSSILYGKLEEIISQKKCTIEDFSEIKLISDSIKEIEIEPISENIT